MAKQDQQSLRNEILEVGRRIYARGYVASNDGNISARIDAQRILITPTGVSKGFMKAQDLVVIDMNGRVVRGRTKPSSEMLMHLRVYKERPDVNSVCHAHPPYATGFAVAGIPLDQCVLPEAIITLGTVPIIEYGTPGTEECSAPLLSCLQDFDAFLMANHGALTVGKDVLSAYLKMETLEHVAHIVCVARQLGNVNVLNGAQVEKLLAQRTKYGVRDTVGALKRKNP